MFKWANKQPLEVRQSKSKHKSVCSQKSTPSSPGHSTQTIDSRILRDNINRKKILLKIKNTDKRSVKNLYQDEHQSQDNKSKLLQLIEQKMQTNRKQCIWGDDPGMRDNSPSNCSKRLFYSPKKEQKTVENANQHWHHSAKCKKSIIKIVLPQNQLLPEFMQAHWEIREKTWNMFTMAVISHKLGFIRDLVHDRETVKLIWSELFSPDILIFYIFLEKLMGNRVNIPEAANCLNIKDIEFATFWMKTNSFSEELKRVMTDLRNNRNSRKNSRKRE